MEQGENQSTSQTFSMAKPENVSAAFESIKGNYGNRKCHLNHRKEHGYFKTNFYYLSAFYYCLFSNFSIIEI